ncbi:hypothetical protein NDU88_000132 [Pleurodeles waltl]|uniref:Secreted protein n=1 Tax=Pleurodeles waltl TaxID=8319 RepID=A0AAV7KSP4_PLEWA|nr:hypothetical protein NDU88_000132 [Pleurodeles waltl]
MCIKPAFVVCIFRPLPCAAYLALALYGGKAERGTDAVPVELMLSSFLRRGAMSRRGSWQPLRSWTSPR